MKDSKKGLNLVLTDVMYTQIGIIQFYIIPKVAQALQVTPQTIRAYIKKGRLKSTRIGRPILVTDKNIRAFWGHRNK